MAAPPATTAGALAEVPGVSHRFVDVGEAVLHVAEAGDPAGSTIVLLHGWPQHWWTWRHVIGPLADAGWHVLAFDLRGAGWSSAPKGSYEKAVLAGDVVAGLDALGIERFHLVGHDWGGWVTQLIARDHPERVEAATVMSIASLWVPPSVALRRLHRFTYQPLVAAPGLGAAMQRSGVFWKVVERAGLPPDAVAEYRRALRDPAHAQAASRLYRHFLAREASAGLRSSGSGEQPERIDVPMSALVGSDDPVITVAMLEPLHERTPSFSITVLDGCGHFLADERPAAVVEHLLAFHGSPGTSA